ncbi:hypothetical protein LdCL_150009800 [Leishmania donovani]|uniref:Uncharacterized protein n=1 Tax=Leishmania donovani TaxID=5661 RepID=A0A3S7WTE4_LEIDO|nr:hypothetical protein LdCL_150009800 [Leishmania donovani]
MGAGLEVLPLVTSIENAGSSAGLSLVRGVAPKPEPEPEPSVVLPGACWVASCPATPAPAKAVALLATAVADDGSMASATEIST